MTSVSPSLALEAGPPRIEDDWFAGFLNATFVPGKNKRQFKLIKDAHFLDTN